VTTAPHAIKFGPTGSAECHCGWSTNDTGSAAITAVREHIDPPSGGTMEGGQFVPAPDDLDVSAQRGAVLDGESLADLKNLEWTAPAHPYYGPRFDALTRSQRRIARRSASGWNTMGWGFDRNECWRLGIENAERGR
jgi:hypothetical protein